MNDVILRMKNISKEFPGVMALSEVNFEVRKGQVLALVGENGAGKSTLMKILSGAWPYPTYKGDIYFKEKLVRFNGIKDAQANGIAIIFQELNMVQDMTVAENIFLDRWPTTNLGIIDWNKLNHDAQNLLDRLSIHEIYPTQKINELTVGKQQLVEIAKALSLDAEVLVFDEPTSALTDKEVLELFRVIRDLKSREVAMVYISHKMDELFEIADELAVLRDGHTIGNAVSIKDIKLDEVIKKMVGRDISDMYPKESFPIGDISFEVKTFEVDHQFLPGEKKVKDVSFIARKGEILGIAGLMGAGRSELVTGLFGGLPGLARGDVFIDRKKVQIKTPQDAINNGLALVTEDRKLFGLILCQSVRRNITLASLKSFCTFGLIDHHKENQIAQESSEEMCVKTANLDVLVETLSGGNQQKVVIGKWLNTHPKVLILDEPTRGIDVGAKVEIYKLMNKLVKEGVTVIIVSSDLPEILGMCDRILVMCQGKIVKELKKSEATREIIISNAMGNFV